VRPWEIDLLTVDEFNAMCDELDALVD